MTAILLDGKGIFEQILQEVKNGIKTNNLNPTLSVILADGNPASEVYVRKKVETCERVGITSRVCRVSKDVSKYELMQVLERENQDKDVNGILVQLPLPRHLNQYDFFDQIDVKKDVDVFHPENVGLLVQGRPRFKPCTPHGIQIMLARSGISVKGKHVCVISRSDVVGKPLFSMLIQDEEYANATVTVCHDNTPPEELKRITKQVDVVIVAVGIRNFLKGDMIKQGSVVIDVGINREGDKVFGDADMSVREVASYVSSVPGGVGLLTVSCLMLNTFLAAKEQS